MLSGVLRAIKYAFGFREIHLTEENARQLVLSYGATSTTFERSARQVRQNGKLVADFGVIEGIHLQQLRNQDAPLTWQVTVSLRGARKVKVGECSDRDDASIIAAHISTVTGKPVEVIGPT